MARVMGLNTITTYCFWNVHEPSPGKFVFTGDKDVADFVKMAQQEGLWVILRPGPYVCAEWEFGGYPWWLLNIKGLRVRTRDPRFLAASKRWLDALGQQLAPLQITRGGPIILVQVENEYGSYGHDTVYESDIEKLIRKAGFNTPLFTADGDWLFANAALSGVLPGANGETDPEQLKTLVNRYHGGKGPYFIPEYYPGWLDHWGEPFQKVSGDSVVRDIDRLLSAGVSFNFYMFHGGTNFGFMNGANYTREIPIQPDITSYDYDAPLSESGLPNSKFFAIRRTLLQHLPPGTHLPDPPLPAPVIRIPEFRLQEQADIFHHLPVPVKAVLPMNMEALGQGYGYLLYRTRLPAHGAALLTIKGLRDYALLFLDGKKVGVLNRMYRQDSILLPADKESRLDIFVENLGRINYGAELPDNHKGITGDVWLNDTRVKDWQMYRFPFSDPANFQFRVGTPPAPDHPVVRRGSFLLSRTGDSFLDMRGWGKGAAWINGHALGRYWDIGPQQTLYVPGCWLKKGVNDLILFEELKPEMDSIRSLDHPILDQLEN